MAQPRDRQEKRHRVLDALRPGQGHGRRIANIAHLLAGNGIGAVLGLAAYALTARSLGVSDYGHLALILTFARLVERLISFQSWQPLIKYGAGLWGTEAREDLRALLKFGLLLDAIASLGGFVVAVIVAYLIAPVFDWTGEQLWLVIAYSSVLLFGFVGVPTAVQRLSGNYRLLAYGQLVSLLMRVVLCALGALIGGDLRFFVAVWAGTQILGNVVLLILALRTLRSEGLGRILDAPLAGIASRFPGVWNFTWSANISLTLRGSANEFDTLLVGALADPASAGLYHIAKRLGRAGLQVGTQVQSVIYPDVARLWAAGKVHEFKRVVAQVEGALLALGVLGFALVWLTADQLLIWTAGPEFLGARNLVIVQMAAVGFIISGSAARSALLAMGRQRDVLRVVVVATIAFQVTAVLLIPRIGAMGGNVAHIVLGLIWTAGLGLALRRGLNVDPGTSPAAGPPPREGRAQADLLAPGGA